MPVLDRPLSYTLLTIFLGGALFIQLGVNQLQSWDEAIYAQVAKEMVQSGDWLTPHWNGEIFLQKPPLSIWATAVMFRLFGVNEFCARVFAAVCGVACLVLTFYIGRLFLTDAQAFVAGVVLLFTPHFNYYARQGSMDVPLVAFLLLAIYGYLKSKKYQRWWIVVGVGFGLAVLTKGVAAFPGVFAVGLAILIAKERPWKFVEFWIGVVLFAAIAGSWHVAMSVIHGRLFFDEYLGSQVFSRSVSTFDTTPSSPFTYIGTVFLGFLPFTPFLIFGVMRLWRARMFPIALSLFALSTFLLYSLIPTKHHWYMVPIYPVLALILCSANRIPRVLAIPLLLVAGAYSIMLDRAIPSLHPDEPGVIAKANQESGPLNVPIDIAPAVLFYTDRKICTNAPHHSMGRLTACQ